MIFCNRCGAYAAKGATVCPKCNSDLSAFGHESMSRGNFVPLSGTPAATSVLMGATALDLTDYGSFSGRFVAVFVDGLLMLVAMLALTVVIALVFKVGVPDLQKPAQGAAMIGGFLVVYLLALLAPAVYEIVMIGQQGATIGKKSRRLVVVRTNGEAVSMGRSVLRYLIKMFLSSIFLIGYLIALFTAKKQALHDLIADTIVVHTS